MTDKEHEDLNIELRELLSRYGVKEATLVTKCEYDHAVGVWAMPMDHSTALRLLSDGIVRIGN